MHTAFKTEDELINNAPECYNAVSKIVDSLCDPCRWFFKVAYRTNEAPETYYVEFSSYITFEYRNFRLSIKAVLIDNEYECSILEHVTA